MTNGDTRKFLLEFYKIINEEETYMEFEDHVLDADVIAQL